ncbi:MAG: beta-ACP synthase, partial [Hyphomicrobiales bacterium]
PEGCARAIAHCIADAGLNPEDIGYINAHGTGTIANDRTETAALKLVLGQATGDVWVSSTKSMHGHALGGTAAMEFVLATQAVRSGIMPPTINMTEPDPECDLRHVENQAVEVKIDVALSNSFAFGGLNAVLAIRRV